MNKTLYTTYFADNKTIAFIGQRGAPPDFPGTSGIEFYAYQRMKTLVAKHKTVLSYIRSWAMIPKRQLPNQVVTLRIPSINTKHLDTITYALFASIHVCFTDADVVWYQGVGPAMFAFLPRLWGKQVITTVHSADWKRDKWSSAAKIILRLSAYVAIKSSHAITCVSTALTDRLSKQYHVIIYPDRLHVQKHEGVALKIIAEKYHLHPNQFVLFLGRFVPEKRLEWLIRASVEIPGLTFVLSGGSSHSDAYAQHLKTLAKNQNIIFTGYVFGREKAELLSNCRLFILPSKLEGYPVSVSEALGYGRRCLIGDFLRSEYPPDHKLIYYFRNASFPDFLEKIKLLIKNEPLGL